MVRWSMAWLVAFICLLPTVTLAAEESDLPTVITQLSKIIPDFKLDYAVERTRSRAYVSEKQGGSVLTIDPDFLNFISPTALLFVVAHEYAHVYFHHQEKL
uniref:hypothetical protein n=1 Tax=Limnobacter sp. TaxID=2003368 RepID=UPI002582A2EC